MVGRRSWPYPPTHRRRSARHSIKSRRNLDWDELTQWAAKSRREFVAEQPYRLLLVLQRQRLDLERLLASARMLLDSKASACRSAEGIFYGIGRSAGSLALLFPGQGAQYPNMLRDLACQMPAMHQVLADADRCYGRDRTESPRLSDLLYPAPVFREEDRQAQKTALQATESAQPALAAVSLGAWQVLQGFGVQADAALGHSLGELVALCVAGRLTPEALHHLAGLRGRLIAAACRESADPGSMLAVLAPAQIISTVLGEEGLELTAANRNAPEQTVLSGPRADIDRVAATFARRQIRTVPLQVAGAFHSPLVAKAREPLRRALEALPFPAGSMPVIANSTGQPYPDDAEQARNLLAGQLAMPVEFQASVEHLYAKGYRHFLEVGPGNRLTGLVDAILAGREHQALALDASSGQRDGCFDLACCLAWLAAQGRPVRIADFAPVADQPAREDAGKPSLYRPAHWGQLRDATPTNSGEQRGR